VIEFYPQIKVLHALTAFMRGDRFCCAAYALMLGIARAHHSLG
jgi:hypothetical protein